MIQNVLIMSIPLDKSNLPVIPVLSHDGDHLQRMANRHPLSSAILRVLIAPFRNSSVSSGPVTNLRRSLSGHVIYTFPDRRLTGERGTVKPPSNSGQTGTHSTPGCSVSKRFTKSDLYNLFPCHLTASPRRHLDISTFMTRFYYHQFQPSRINLCLVYRG